MEMTPILPGTAARARGGGLLLVAAIGRESLARRLLELAALRRAIGGDVVLVEDGTLGGSDRVQAARACGDPQFVSPPSVRAAGFPVGPEWALLLTALDRRRGAYCVALGGAAPEAAWPDLARAIASNRSFALLAEDVPAGLTSHLAALAREGWPYLGASSALVGFAAGGEGLRLAAAILARLEAVLGAGARAPEAAWTLANFVLARESDPILSPFVARQAR